MTFLGAILVLCFAVGCSSTVIQPCGPRMCEHFKRMVGTNESSFDVHSLACNITGRYVEKRATKKNTSDSRSLEASQRVQMRCVMCTEVPIMTTDMRCQTFDGHIVCAVISDRRSCVFTTHIPGEDLNTQTNGINYEYHCGRESGLARIQRQMSCVLLSRLVLEKGLESLQPMKQGVKIFLQPRNVGRKQVAKLERCYRLEKYIRMREFFSLKTQLMEPGDIDCPDKDNTTLIMHASTIYGELNITYFNIILGLGADISLVDSIGLSAFHHACQAYRSLAVVQRFVDLGADIEKRGEKGRTPLLTAYHASEIKIVDYLLSIGCDVNAMDEDGISFKALACDEENKYFVEPILEKYPICNKTRGQK